ncbi:MAG: hypothetical protein IJF92_06250 [Bacilli bacterium]|nr:hypothetical protein [Bacilli bacterium]
MKRINKLLIIALIFGLFSPITTLALSKKETIYNTIDYNGKVNKTIVNNHLYLDTKGSVEDETELKNILNINGDESFKKEGNKLVWNASGKDIFYRGETSKELPLSIKATYYLNGKEMNPKKMVSKKGNIEIKLDFTNNNYLEKDNMYLPLVVTVGTMFKDSENSNINISNGKAVDTGTKTMAVGIASPGLYENTNMSEFSDFDNITIKYDTTNFKLSNVYIIATPKVLESSDFDVFSKIDSLYSAVDKLNSSMDKINNGAKELVGGSKKLVAGVNLITDNINKAYLGAVKLESGSISIDNGLSQIISNLEGAKSKLDTSKLSLLENTNNQKADALFTSLQDQGLNQVKDLFDHYLVKSFGGTYDTPEAANTALQQALLYQEKSVEEVTAIMKLKSMYDIYLLLKLDASAFNETATNINELSTEIDKLIAGLNQVKAGTTSLKEGLTTLKIGLSSLYSGSKTLGDGTVTLSNGTNTLSNGISTFNTEGIKKIVGYSNKFKAYTTKAKKVLNKSREYKGFGSNNVTRTTFVFKMKSVK